MTRFILGSQSPRRKEILEYFSLPFEQMTPPFNEDLISYEKDPIAYVMALSLGKARSLNHFCNDAIILTADTVVWQEGKIFGKPRDDQDAIDTLSCLSGKWHTVYTGLTLKFKGDEYNSHEETRVLFNDLTSSQIRRYQSSVHCKDKAGGYAIQKAGGIIVKKIDGCYTNVMGLPINCICKLLLNVGIDLMDYLK